MPPSIKAAHKEHKSKGVEKAKERANHTTLKMIKKRLPFDPPAPLPVVPEVPEEAKTTTVAEWNSKWPVPVCLFKRYEAVRKSGTMNMLLLPTYDEDFTSEHMLCIMDHYSDMKKMFLNFKSEPEPEPELEPKPATKKLKLSAEDDDSSQ